MGILNGKACWWYCVALDYLRATRIASTLIPSLPFTNLSFQYPTLYLLIANSIHRVLSLSDPSGVVCDFDLKLDGVYLCARG
jgi:hypothetical protein